MEAAKTCCGNLGRVQLPKPLVPGEISLAVLRGLELQHNCNTNCNTATQRCKYHTICVFDLPRQGPFLKGSKPLNTGKTQIVWYLQRCVAVLQFVLQLCCSSSARNTAVGNLGSAGRETGSKPGSEERTKRTLWRRWRTWRLLCNLLLELCMCSGDVVCILSVRLGICSKPFSEERTKPFVCC